MSTASDRPRTSITHLQVIMSLAIVAITIASVGPAQAFLARPVIFPKLGAAAKPPSGWLGLCAENPDECRPTTAAPQITLTPDLLQQLFEINGYANDRVKWTSDMELYGKAERWTYPLDRGDCEDIVLLKRRLLASAGWPIGALLITVVEDPKERGTRHAVLTVRSDRGDFILDNQTPEILFWYETSYRFLLRQSEFDPNVWLSYLNDQPRIAPVSGLSAPAH